MKRVFVLAAGVLMVATWAQAETTDMSKITCDDVMHTFPEDVVIVGAWMSGYYNAKRNNTVVDEKEVAANSKKVAEFCQANPHVTLMNAIEQIAKAH